MHTQQLENRLQSAARKGSAARIPPRRPRNFAPMFGQLEQIREDFQFRVRAAGLLRSNFVDQDLFSRCVGRADTDGADDGEQRVRRQLQEPIAPLLR